MGQPKPVQSSPESNVRAPSERLIGALLLVPIAFNLLHALLMVAVYGEERDLRLQIWLFASGLTLLVQLAGLIVNLRRKAAKTKALSVSERGLERLRAVDFGVLLFALLLFALQAGFLGFALSTSMFGPRTAVGSSSTTGNWERLLWVWYALGATPLAHLQVLVLTPWSAVRLLERGSLRANSARWLLGSCAVLGLATLVLSELVIYFL